LTCVKIFLVRLCHKIVDLDLAPFRWKGWEPLAYTV